jgi:FMN-dependent NADH-azoreductase
MSQIHGLKPHHKTLKVLRIDSSVRGEGSMTRTRRRRLIAQLERSEGPIDLRVRDLASQPPSSWIRTG